MFGDGEAKRQALDESGQWPYAPTVVEQADQRHLRAVLELRLPKSVA
jgi:hypothetical protein